MTRRRNVRPPDDWSVNGEGHLLLGGVPYPVVILETREGGGQGAGVTTRGGSNPPHKAKRLKPGYALLWQTEDVGEEDNYTTEMVTCYFPVGLRYGKLVGSHESTGLPIYELVPAMGPGGKPCEALEDDESDG